MNMRKFSKYSDDELMEIIRDESRRSAAAFDALYEKYSTKLNTFCIFKTNRIEDAEELFEDTWLKFLDAVKKGTNVRGVLPYLYTIARTGAIDRFRRDNNSNRPLLDYKDFEQMEEIVSPLDLQLQIENDNMIEIIKASLDCLDEIYKETFVLQWFGGMSQQEIAEITGTTVANVKVRSHRAMTKLIKLLKPYLADAVK